MDGMALNHTHDADARSWLASANAAGSDFPIQNLPFGVFRRAGGDETFRGGVAIGDQIVDLAALQASGCLQGWAEQAARACAQPALNDFMAMGAAAWSALRHGLFALLEAGASRDAVGACLVPQSQAEFSLPTRIGDYTDFYTSYHHALNIGKLFGIPDVPANFHHIPIAYHGRASSVVISGHPVRRPLGQYKAPTASAPSFGPCSWLDYELELGVFVGTGNALGRPVPLREAAFPQPLPYLDDDAVRSAGAIDIQLAVGLETTARRAIGMSAAPLAQTSFRHQHWTIAQMVAHHTSGGCNLRSGDLLGTGTISGPRAGEAGAMMELAHAGRRPISLHGGDEHRAFLADGDAVVLKAWCDAPGRVRIGFGDCRGEIVPALEGV
jgi:fumarylacetoacetase